jgi:hypothetical protein
VGGGPSAQPGHSAAVAAGSTCTAAASWREKAGTATPDMASSSMPSNGDCPVTGACRSSARPHFPPELSTEWQTQRQALAAGIVDADGCLHVDVLDASQVAPDAGSSIAAAAAAAVVQGGCEEMAAMIATVQPPRQGTVFVEIA